MRAGKLRNRIKVFDAQTTTSPMGGASSHEWVHTLTLWANFEPLSVRDVVSAQTANSDIRARCVLRYRDDITTKMRVEHRGRLYEIDGEPLADARSGVEFMTIMLKGV